MRSTTTARLLRRLAELLGQAVSDTGVDAAVGIELGPDGFEVHLRPADDHGPVTDLLRGFDAPASWDVVGVMATGMAYPLETGRLAAEPVVVVHLQARVGQSCSLVGPPAGPLRRSTGAVGGRVADVCRRSLGLPTDPPRGTPLPWWAARWLDDLATGGGVERYRTEGELLAHFPGGRPFGPTQDLDALVSHGQLLAATFPWPALRRAAAAGAVSVPRIDADDAAWMDDGMFARWASGEVTPCAESLAELLPRLEPRLGYALSTTLRRWDIPIDPAPVAPQHPGGSR